MGGFPACAVTLPSSSALSLPCSEFVGAAPATAGNNGGYGVNNPKVEVDLKGSIDVTLTSKDIEAGYDQPIEAVFLIRVDSGEWTRIEVAVEGEETWSKDFAEDSGDHLVAVKIEGGETKTFTVKPESTVTGGGLIVP